MRRPPTTAGYTLTELLVTLGLIAIFLTLFIAVVSGTMKTLRTVENRTDATQKAWNAMSYLKSHVAEANFYDTSLNGFSSFRLVGHDELGRSYGTAPRPDQDPDAFPCDISPVARDGRIDGGRDMANGNLTGDYLDPLGTIPGGAQAQVLQDPQCVGLDADLELVNLQGAARTTVCPTLPVNVSCPPDANINPDDRNLHLDDTGGVGEKRYRMGWEDLDGSGTFDTAEQHLRTLIYSTRSPTTGSYLENSCPSGAGTASRIERDIVTLAHTWKEKTFWIDDMSYDPGVQGVGVVNDGVTPPGSPNELRTFDFVLYERRTRFYEDANRNLDLDCDDQLDWDPTTERYDERFRTIETPVATGIIDVWFRLLNDDAHEILPCTDPDTAQSSGTCNILNTLLPRYLHTDSNPVGLFYSNCYITNTGTRYPRACSRLDEIRAVEITVVAGSNDSLDLIRRTRDINGKIFSNLTNLDPRKLGPIDYLGVPLPGGEHKMYNPGSLLIIKEKVFLPGFNLGR